jgi:hypothetical protein
LAEYLEVMRLVNSKRRFQSLAPLAFLNLGLDDDCYNFVKWWETSYTLSTGYDLYNPLPLSMKGDWIYLTGQDKMEYLGQNICDLGALVIFVKKQD